MVVHSAHQTEVSGEIKLVDGVEGDFGVRKWLGSPRCEYL